MAEQPRFARPRGLRARAAAVATQAARDGRSLDLVAAGGDQSLIQVIDASGSVVAASPSIEGEPPVVDLGPAPGEVTNVRSDALPIGEGDRFAVVARGTEGPDGPMVVLAAQSLEAVEQSTSVVVRLLAFGAPLLLLTVALTSYWLTGLALSPVEAMRRRVASIESASALSSRVPVPGGGDEISRLGETMNLMLERLDAASVARRRFVADASHELRSPLAMIRTAHEVGVLHPDATDWTTLGGEILDELDRVDRLVSDLLLLARADEHGWALRRREVDLDHMVDTEAHRLRRLGVADVLVHAPPVRVVGDPERLERALRNLTRNAARHADHQVALRLGGDSSMAVIEVSDDGPGIPVAERERVFERFVRLDESRARDSGGSGLGLSIARQIARAHGGELAVTDRSPGATLRLTLPLAETPPEAQEPR